MLMSQGKSHDGAKKVNAEKRWRMLSRVFGSWDESARWGSAGI